MPSGNHRSNGFDTGENQRAAPRTPCEAGPAFRCEPLDITGLANATAPSENGTFRSVDSATGGAQIRDQNAPFRPEATVIFRALGLGRSSAPPCASAT